MALLGGWRGTGERPGLVWTAADSAALDRWLEAERGLGVDALMEAAGRNLAVAVEELLDTCALRRVVWMVGPGHNGGDALVAARQLRASVDALLWRPLRDEPAPALDATTLLVDGLFGVGLARPLAGAAREAVARVNGSSAHVLAVDVPSGLHATTGEVLGAGDGGEGGLAVVARHTLAFVGPKTGFFVGAGPAHVGLWRTADIGFPVEEAEAWLVRRRHRRQDG